MLPIDPEPRFGRLIVLAKDQPQYTQLPVRVSDDKEVYMTSKWELSSEEKEAIAQGANVYLRVMTFGHPFQPVSLWVEG